MEDYIAIGKSVRRVDGPGKVKGEVKFCDDLYLPGMLYGKILRSPHPHARILHIEVKRARRLSGIKAIITGQDVPNKKYGIWRHIPETLDETILCSDKVRFIGDGVAAVAATTEDLAQEALESIKVDYEILPAVFDPIEAMESQTPLIHDKPKNIAWEVTIRQGEVEKGFEEADWVREDEFSTPAQNHAALEPHCAVACFDASGRLTLYSTTQSPYLFLKDLSFVLGLNSGDIRVVAPPVGGGFGGKFQILPLDFCAVILSRISGKPVKIAYTRQEVFQATRQRHPMKIWLKTGFNKNGALVAKRCRIVADNGAYNSIGPTITGRAGAQLSMVYKVKHFEYQGFLVYTNNPVGGAFRGFGNMQARFADESQMDLIAEDLRMDPVELRLKNARQSGEVTPHGWKVTSCGLSECIQKAREESGWDVKKQKKIAYRGLGIACNSYISGINIDHKTSSARLKVDPDGTVTVFSGGVDIGQGSNTALCQIAAERLGIESKKIKMSANDTDLTPVDCGSFGSRVTLLVGKAVAEAAHDAKTQLISLVSDLLEANADDLELREGWFRVKGSPERGITFDQAVRVVLSRKNEAIVGRGVYDPKTEKLNPKTGGGNISPAYSFGAQIIEVEVNPVTGRIKILNVTAAHDGGVAINPQSFEGQIEGAIAQGLGYALMEDLSIENGEVKNASYLSYRIPTALDMPKIKSILVETVDPEGPFGAKGVSEGTILPIAPAIANAVDDAIGVRVRDLPITPEKILAALKHRRDLYHP